MARETALLVAANRELAAADALAAGWTRVDDTGKRWTDHEGRLVLWLPVATCVAGRSKGTVVYLADRHTLRPDWRDLSAQIEARGFVAQYILKA